MATKQSLSEVPQFNYGRFQLHNEIATPRQVGARNDKQVALDDLSYEGIGSADIILVR
jgi:hypothetical protein